MAEKIECLCRTTEDEPCPLGDRRAEQSFIKIQTTIIVAGVLIHSFVVGWAGRVISNQLDVKPADVLEQVHQVRHDQETQYETLSKRLAEIRNDYPERVVLLLNAIERVEDKIPEQIE